MMKKLQNNTRRKIVDGESYQSGEVQSHFRELVVASFLGPVQFFKGHQILTVINDKCLLLAVFDAAHDDTIIRC